MTREILRLFVHTLTADDKYSLLNRGNLTQYIQMYLSQKQKLSQLFCVFLKCTLNFEHFQKKLNLIADVFSKLRKPRDVVRLMYKRSRFRGYLKRLHGKQAETLIQSQRQHLYHIY